METSKSILSLNNDCLSEILEFLDDYRAFFSFTLTCKRFYQASLNIQSWNVNIVKRKIRFFGTRFVINEYPEDKKYHAHFPLIDDLERISEMYKLMKPTLHNVKTVWKTKGPVAARMFTWIKDIKLRNEYDGDGNIEHAFRKLTFNLPFLSLRNKELTVDIHFEQPKKQLTITFAFGPRVKMTFTPFESYNHIQFYQSFDKEQLKRASEIFEPMLSSLQAELGGTSHPITARFFLWLCFYPDSLICHSNKILNDNEKIFFTESTKNEEPTDELICLTTALECFSDEPNLMKIIGESENVEMMKKMVPFLPKDSKYKILKTLNKEIFFILSDATSMTNIVSKNNLLNLVLRISFLPNTFSELHESEVTNFHFRAKGARALRMAKFGLPFGKFQSVWNFYLDNQEIHWNIGEFSRWMAPDQFEKGQDPFDKLQPITNLIQECVHGSMKHLTNRFTEKLLRACENYQYCDKLYYS